LFSGGGFDEGFQHEDLFHNKEWSIDVGEAWCLYKGNHVNARVDGSVTMSGNEIADIRKSIGLTQVLFAERYRIPVGTLMMWEQGHRQIHGASLWYLRLIQSDPEGIAERLEGLDSYRKKAAA
jgi:DNA-binding transcriptional regulator YiaG